MKGNKEAVLVDTKIGELIKALNIGKDEKMAGAIRYRPFCMYNPRGWEDVQKV